MHPPQSAADPHLAQDPAHPDSMLPSRPAPASTIVLLIVAQVFALIARAILQRSLEARGMPGDSAHLWSYLVVPPLLLVMLWPLVRRHWPLLRSKLRRSQLSWRIIGLGIAVGLTLRLALWGKLIGAVGFGWIQADDPGSLPNVYFSFNCPPPAFIILHLAVMATLVPILEEAANRGLLLQWLRHKGTAFAVSGSAFAFAVMHRPDMYVDAFVVALYLGVLCVNTGSLWGPLAAHVTLNAIIVLDWYCLNGAWNPVAPTAVTRVVGLLGLALLACGAALAMLLVSRRIAGSATGNPPRPATAR